MGAGNHTRAGPAWRIYYDGPTGEPVPTFDSTQGTPGAAPGWGVQAIAFAHAAVGRKILRGADYYVYRRVSGWVPIMGEVCFIEYVVNNPPENPDGVIASKSGRMLSSEAYERANAAAHDDPDFPRKSNASRDETPGPNR